MRLFAFSFTLVLLLHSQLSCASFWRADAPIPGHIAANPGGTYPESEQVFADDIVHKIAINVTPERLASMLVIEQPDVQANATIDGEVFTDIGLSYKGGQSTWTACFQGTKFNEKQCPEKSLAITFDKYNESINWHSIKKIALNALMLDKTALHDKITVAVYRDAGVVVERVTYASVTLNGVDKGLFTLFEYITKKSFAKDRFPKSEGFKDHVTYKDCWPVFQNQRPYYINHVENDVESNDTQYSLTFVENFAKELSQAVVVQAKPLEHDILLGEPTHPLVQVVRKHMDMDQLVRTAIADRLMLANDGCMLMFVADIKNTSTQLSTPLCKGNCGPHNCAWIHVRQERTISDPNQQDRIYIGEHDHDLNWGQMAGGMGGAAAPSAGYQQYDQDWFNYSTTAACQGGGGGMMFQMLPPRCDPIWRAVGMNGARAVIDAWKNLRAKKLIDAAKYQTLLTKTATLIEPYMQANLSSWRQLVQQFNASIASRIQLYDQMMTKLETNECMTNNGGCGQNMCQDDFIGSHCTTKPVSTTTPSACVKIPCGIHGVCTDQPPSYTCTCYDGYGGDSCSQEPQLVPDTDKPKSKSTGTAKPSATATSVKPPTSRSSPTTPVQGEGSVVTPVPDLDATPDGTNPNPGSNNTPQMSSPSNTLLWAVLIAVGVLVVAGVVIFVTRRNRATLAFMSSTPRPPQQAVDAYCQLNDHP